MKRLNRFFIFLVLVSPFYTLAQDSLKYNGINKKKLTYLSASTGLAYSASLFALHNLWYKDFEKQSFHFFNDNNEWKQMDKAGHFFSAFQLSYTSSKALQWTGVTQHKSDLIGAIAGFALLLPIEIFDGYSAAYGASVGDLAANALGAGFYLTQQHVWNEVRIYPKVSFQRTPYAPLRPEVLGDSFVTELFKDYNGQTMWLSFDIDKFMKFPKWLNIAVGYGAEGMVYARDAQNIANGYQANRQFYFALDPDLTTIKSKSKVIRTALFLANMIKLPAPSLEIGKGKQKFYLFYF